MGNWGGSPKREVETASCQEETANPLGLDCTHACTLGASSVRALSDKKGRNPVGFLEINYVNRDVHILWTCSIHLKQVRILSRAIARGCWLDRRAGAGPRRRRSHGPVRLSNRERARAQPARLLGRLLTTCYSHLLLATCDLLPPTRYLLLATCYLLLDPCYLLPATCYLLPANCHLPPATCYFLPPTCYMLLATCYLLPPWMRQAATRPN